MATLVVLAALAASAGCSGSSDGRDTAAPDQRSGAVTTSITEGAGVDHTGEGDADVVLSTAGDVVATVDRRFQSYNIEMVEVTGGEFWKPYDTGDGKVVRPPLDLGSERLRNLARALGPAYIRVSGSWANSTYFDPDATAGQAPPNGFGGLLTGDQWREVGSFARSVDAEVTTSFASNDAVRDPSGAWQDDQARALLEFSAANDVPLTAVELFNEPGLPVGMPSGYTRDDYARDVGTFLSLVDNVMPDLRIAGPGATADVVPLVISPTITGSALADGAAPRRAHRCGSPRPRRRRAAGTAGPPPTET